MLKKGINFKQFSSLSQTNNRTVVKGKAVRQEEVKKVIVNHVKEQPEVQNQKNTSIEPIIENGSIVGLYHNCGCGLQSEIRFELIGEENKSQSDE